MSEVIIPLPAGFTLEHAAKTFNVYLVGVNWRDPNTDKDSLGPFFNEVSDKWQLDAGNDYWLRLVDRDKLKLTCRYDGRQFALLQAMAEVFKLRYLPT